MDYEYGLMIPISPKDLEAIFSGKKTIILTKQDSAKLVSTIYLYQTKDPNYKYRIFQNLKPLQGKVIGQATYDFTTRYESEFWDDQDVYQAITRYVPSEDPEDEDYLFKMWSSDGEESYEETKFATTTCTTYKQMRKWLGTGLKNFYGIVIEDPIMFEKARNIQEFLKPCCCPEMPYCPACKFGYEYMSEEEAEFYRMGEGAFTEWYCHNVVKNPPAPFTYCIYNPEGRV